MLLSLTWHSMEDTRASLALRASGLCQSIGIQEATAVAPRNLPWDVPYSAKQVAEVALGQSLHQGRVARHHQT